MEFTVSSDDRDPVRNQIALVLELDAVVGRYFVVVELVPTRALRARNVSLRCEIRKTKSDGEFPKYGRRSLAFDHSRSTLPPTPSFRAHTVLAKNRCDGKGAIRLRRRDVRMIVRCSQKGRWIADREECWVNWPRPKYQKSLQIILLCCVVSSPDTSDLLRLLQRTHRRTRPLRKFNQGMEHQTRYTPRKNRYIVRNSAGKNASWCA